MKGGWGRAGAGDRGGVGDRGIGRRQRAGDRGGAGAVVAGRGEPRWFLAPGVRSEREEVVEREEEVVDAGIGSSLDWF